MTGRIRLVRPRLHLRDWVIIAMAAAAAVGFLYLAGQVGNQRQQLDALSVALTRQRGQATESGQTPVAPSPEDIRKDPRVVQGRPGERGPSGPPGAPGRSGTPGSPGPSGSTGAAGVPGEPGPSGPPGAPGRPGPPGAPGRPGADGAPGEDGTDGQDGQDGSPPASWTWTDLLGAMYVCKRDEGSTNAEPTYTCTRTTEGAKK